MWKTHCVLCEVGILFLYTRTLDKYQSSKVNPLKTRVIYFCKTVYLISEKDYYEEWWLLKNLRGYIW